MRKPSVEQRLLAREYPKGLRRVMRQRWDDLLFLHWSYDAALLQALLPDGLFIDTFLDEAYIGVVPFCMNDIRPFGLPAIALYSDFLELNVRTYVHDSAGNPGVWFFSLDANNWLSVEAARRLYHLPYLHAEMEADRDAVSEEISFSSLRVGADELQRATFRYAPAGPLETASEKSLEFFLLERYRLFSERNGKLYSGMVNHPAYQFCPVSLIEFSEILFPLNGMPPPDAPPIHAVMCPGVEVEIFPLQAC